MTLRIKNASQDADSFGTNICVCYNSLNSLTPPHPHQFPHVIYKTKRKFMNFIANVRHYITDNIIFYKGEEPFSRVLLNCTVHTGAIFTTNSPKYPKSTKNPIARWSFQRNRYSSTCTAKSLFAVNRGFNYGSDRHFGVYY